MVGFKNIQSCQYEISESNGGAITIHLQGRMDSTNASQMIELFGSLIKDRSPGSLTVDLKKVTYLDDFGALVLVELRKLMTLLKGHFNLKNAREEVIFTLGSEALVEVPALIKAPLPNLFIRLGDAILQWASDVKYLISFLGSVCLAFIYSFSHPKSLRTNDVFLYMQKIGVDALPIVGMIGFLMGLIVAFMSSVQLQMFGADIYVASLVSLAMTREFGPIMTAIIVAGRSGSSFASEIGTMKISKEVDALFTMGFDPTRYLVVPKILASVLVVPILTLFSDVFAIAGGLTVGVLMLDLTANAYILQTLKTLSLFDVLLGIIKSSIFAFLVSWISCLRGFRVKGGAASVGQATTSAVVSGIFLIILFDSIFVVILRYLR